MGQSVGRPPLSTGNWDILTLHARVRLTMAGQSHGGQMAHRIRKHGSPMPHGRVRPGYDSSAVSRHWGIPKCIRKATTPSTVPQQDGNSLCERTISNPLTSASSRLTTIARAASAARTWCCTSFRRVRRALEQETLSGRQYGPANAWLFSQHATHSLS